MTKCRGENKKPVRTISMNFPNGSGYPGFGQVNVAPVKKNRVMKKQSGNVLIFLNPPSFSNPAKCLERQGRSRAMEILIMF
jgi:hypothetical protein